jgi:hypothetical protein
MRAREYLPNEGRFLSPDPIGVFGGGNFYAFVLGKPLKLRDPFGLSGLDFSPPLTMQPYNWRWAPIDPEAGIQRSLPETDPHFEAFRNEVDWLAGQKPSPINYIDMGGWLLSGELNRELDNIFGAVGWAMNKVDPDGSVSGVYFPQNGKAPTFPQVWRAGTGLWSANTGISVRLRSSSRLNNRMRLISAAIASRSNDEQGMAVRQLGVLTDFFSLARHPLPRCGRCALHQASRTRVSGRAFCAPPPSKSHGPSGAANRSR